MVSCAGSVSALATPCRRLIRLLEIRRRRAADGGTGGNLTVAPGQRLANDLNHESADRDREAAPELSHALPVLLRAMVPLTAPTLPNLAGTRVLICSGDRDSIIPLENAKGLATLFRDSGADVTHRVEKAGHQLVFDELAAAKEWLQPSSQA